MRRIILLLLLFVCNAAKAQLGWQTTEFEADELKGQSAYTAYFYTDEDGNKLTMWSSEKDYFRITSGTHIFDYIVSGSVKEVGVTVGFYDKNDNLIEKIQMTFWPDDNPRIAHNSIFMPRNKKKGEKVIQYLQKEEGYVRFIAPLYHSVSGFDLKVPCIKSATKDQQALTQSVYETINKGITEVILRKVQIIGLSDSVEIDKYYIKVENWIQKHQKQMTISKEIDSLNSNHIFLHVKQDIAPNLILIKQKNGNAKLEYDIVIDVDTINQVGEWSFENILYEFNIYDIDYNLSLSVLDEMIAELDVILELCQDERIGTAFYIDERFLRNVNNAQSDTKKMEKYLSLYGSLLLVHSAVLLDFPINPY
jgi:hypothetical protein